MKKAYQKPQMIVEDFVVSDYFANCGASFQFGAACAPPTGMDGPTWESIYTTVSIFSDTPTHCTGDTIDRDSFDTIFPQDNVCYFTASGTAVIGS